MSLRDFCLQWAAYLRERIKLAQVWEVGCPRFKKVESLSLILNTLNLKNEWRKSEIRNLCGEPLASTGGSWRKFGRLNFMYVAWRQKRAVGETVQKSEKEEWNILAIHLPQSYKNSFFTQFRFFLNDHKLCLLKTTYLTGFFVGFCVLCCWLLFVYLFSSFLPLNFLLFLRFYGEKNLFFFSCS